MEKHTIYPIRIGPGNTVEAYLPNSPAESGRRIETTNELKERYVDIQRVPHEIWKEIFQWVAGDGIGWKLDLTTGETKYVCQALWDTAKVCRLFCLLSQLLPTGNCRLFIHQARPSQEFLCDSETLNQKWWEAMKNRVDRCLGAQTTQDFGLSLKVAFADGFNDSGPPTRFRLLLDKIISGPARWTAVTFRGLFANCAWLQIYSTVDWLWQTTHWREIHEFQLLSSFSGVDIHHPDIEVVSLITRLGTIPQL
ncbi:hypothetical protein PM082_002382 [Marasmius tenuissimus]|nr:hypothetical protein PM082_002382 [Marasmius tenuissimus]